ncbi:MAG: amino acid--tRNA ligase-related protein [Candidatus Jorgensenbacteria bacterium]|nr:amino acid--tRNA ligase-related protein [Candidatus Jorgensenbacteria bacterium]
MERTLIRDIVAQEGKEVLLKGWADTRRDHGKLVFIDLRDRSGTAQIVFTANVAGADAGETGGNIRSEDVIEVRGTVKQRPKGMVNEKLPHHLGHYEIQATSFAFINRATDKGLPIPIDGDGYDIGEEVRMEYRYVDLRRVRLQKNLKNRAQIVKFIRDFLSARDFVEVETPILSKSTPEGARDYLVPSRLAPGNFYALPQSPQQYKQLLMVAGLERYFQIARCFRDEDTRGDRQPEFTQLDLEMSFVTQEDIVRITEELFTSLVRELYPEKKIPSLPFPRLTHAEAMKKYRSDKPDLRKKPEDPNELAFVWITDFPMFEKKDDGSLGAVHHPFTLPTTDTSADPVRFQHESYPEYRTLMKALDSEQSSLTLKAYQYDLVLNGFEIGGGSIRTYDKKLLAKVFERLGNNPKTIEAQFGHLLKAFDYGVPPHGGIAPGIDRFVMVMENEPNIREVIAFPKTGDGRDLMMHAPSEVAKEQLNELGLELAKKKTKKRNGK